MQESANNLYIWNDMNEVSEMSLLPVLTLTMVAFSIQRSRDHSPQGYPIPWRVGEP
jgi:hypothetical protein